MKPFAGPVHVAVLAAAVLSACTGNPFTPSAQLVMVGSASQGPKVAAIAAEYGIDNIDTRFDGTGVGVAAFCGQNDSNNDGDGVIDMLVIPRGLKTEEADACVQDGTSYETLRYAGDTVLIRTASFGTVVGLSALASHLRRNG